VRGTLKSGQTPSVASSFQERSRKTVDAFWEHAGKSWFSESLHKLPFGVDFLLAQA